MGIDTGSFNPDEYKHQDPPKDLSPKSCHFQKPKNRFLIGLAAATALLAAEKTGITSAAADFLTNEKSQLLESEKTAVETDKIGLSKLIQEGIADTEESGKIIDEYNSLVVKFQQVDKESPEAREIKLKLRQLDAKLSRFSRRRLGDTFSSNLTEAIPFAEKLLENEQALSALAKLRVAFERYSGEGDSQAVRYYHNNAAAYLELGGLSPGVIEFKTKELADYCKISGLDLDKILQEDILFYLLDSAFDFKLIAKDVEKLLDNRNPEWRTSVADQTKIIKSNNDLRSFNIFELNRIRQAIIQMSSPDFAKKVFSERDRDLKEYNTELGGVVPFPEKNKGLSVVDPKKKESNSSYIVPTSNVVLRSTGVVPYHFHATEINEPKRGPSDGDTGDSLPKVVFTSIDPKQIAIHFFVSRYNKKTGYYNDLDIVSLGVLKRPADFATTRKK